jgi:DNA mismatch repair protein MutS2
LQQNGDVLSVDGTNALVQMGALRSRVSVSDLERTSGSGDDEVGEPSRPSQPMPQATPDASTETDIRGLRAADVEPRLEQYLQDAYLTGLPWVRIIHGKGTGALRKVVRDVLQANPVVERSETARQNEGGDGATVAWLRSG